MSPLKSYKTWPREREEPAHEETLDENIRLMVGENDELMSDREPTRWQHNRIYPHPINPCLYTYDSICH